MSLETQCKHGKVGYCVDCEAASVRKYSISGRMCRVCGEITGAPEADACFEHDGVPIESSDPAWLAKYRPK